MRWIEFFVGCLFVHFCMISVLLKRFSDYEDLLQAVVLKQEASEVESSHLRDGYRKIGVFFEERCPPKLLSLFDEKGLKSLDSRWKEGYFEYHFLRGRLFHDERKYEKALQEFEHALNLIFQLEQDRSSLRDSFQSCLKRDVPWYLGYKSFNLSGVQKLDEFMVYLRDLLQFLRIRCLKELGNYNMLRYPSMVLLEQYGWSTAFSMLGVVPGELIYPRVYSSYVNEASSDFGVSNAFFYAVMKEESHFDVRAKSGVGAMGLMQIMPSTGRYLWDKIKMKSDGLPDEFREEFLYRADLSIRLGGYYLSYLHEKLNGDMQMVLAAYNSGLKNALRWKKRAASLNKSFYEVIDFPETKDYVHKVLTAYDYYSELYGEF